MLSSELALKVEERMKNLEDFWPRIEYLDEETIRQIKSQGVYVSTYHQWLYCLIKVLNPKVVLELGTHWGTATSSMLAGMPKGSKLYTINIIDQWRGVSYNEKLIRMIGDDLDLDVYKKHHLDLETVELWFIDSDHTEEHIRNEFKTFSRFWKPGTVVVMDDVDEPRAVKERGGGEDWTNGVYKIWQELPYDKIELPHLHFSGFGFFIV